MIGVVHKIYWNSAPSNNTWKLIVYVHEFGAFVLEYDDTFLQVYNGNTKPTQKLPCDTKQQADFTY